MKRTGVDGEPALALAFFLFVCAGLLEMIAISQSGGACGDGSPLALVAVICVPFLWIGGLVSLYVATRDPSLRGSRWTGAGGVVALFVAIFFIPTLVSPISGCFS